MCGSLYLGKTRISFEKRTCMLILSFAQDKLLKYTFKSQILKNTSNQILLDKTIFTEMTET